MQKKSLALGSIALSLALVAGCSTAPKTMEGRAALDHEAQATVEKMSVKDPGLMSFLNSYPGYVVFPSIGEGAVVVGGGYGHGVVFERGTPVGYADMSKGSVGLALGGQSYSEIIVFQTTERLNQFKSSQATFTANASAVAVKAGAAAATQFKDGVAVFADSEAGLMAEASIGGQRFTYQGR